MLACTHCTQPSYPPAQHVLLLLAMAASRATAIRGLLGKLIRSLQDGGNYCTFSPNTTCYSSGWPSCCGVDSNASASSPKEQPPCNYCEVGPASDASLGCGTPGQSCQLEIGVCKNEDSIHPGVCVETPDMCIMDMNPVW